MMTKSVEESKLTTKCGPDEPSLVKFANAIKKIINQIMKDPDMIPKMVESRPAQSAIISEKQSMYSSVVPQPMKSHPTNGMVNFQWDRECCSQNITLAENNMWCFLTETGYCFRSVVSTTGIVGGIGYWEIHGEGRTENELKIGVVSKKTLNLNTVN